MRCEMKMSGVRGLGNPGATRGVIISQFIYNARTAAIILNEEAIRRVGIRAGRSKERKTDLVELPSEGS
jgi:hypothetical protein